MDLKNHFSLRRSLAVFLTSICGFFAATSVAKSKPVFLESTSDLVPGIAPHGKFPSASELRDTRVVLLSSASWNDAAREEIQNFVEKGGGLVLLHDAIPDSGFITGEVQRWTGATPLFFTPVGREQEIAHGISNFDIEDEMFHGFELADAASVLATTWAPNRKNLKGTDPQPYVYGVSPMIWAQELGNGRVVGIIPGKNSQTLKHPAVHAMLVRALNWAGRLPESDALESGVAPETLTHPPGGPLAPQASVDTLQTHPDFKIDLVAAEPLISKPLNLDWDAKGRLWVIESVEYPEGRQGGGPESMYSVWQHDSNLPKPPPVPRPAGDTVSWLEDTNGDGVMDQKHVFADDLDLATSFCFYKDGIIVAQPPEILRLRDTDGDGKADRREVLFTGLGTFDRHAVLNNLRWGLDGWIYATHGYSSSPRVTSGDGKTDFGPIGSGVVRFRADGSAIEMVSAKSGNCWGVSYTSDGEIFFTQPTSGDLVMHLPTSDRIMAEGKMGEVPSWNVLVHLRPVKPLMSWEEIVENQPNDVIGSFTAACGCAIYEGGAWPAEWDQGYFTAEPTVHILHHEKITSDGVSYLATKTRDEEFSATRDFWTRPVDTRIGPDGQLYAIDFYNQAILHNDPRGPIHLWNNQAARPDRDHFFGRILRYRNVHSKHLPSVDLTTMDGQIAALNHPNRPIRFRAQRSLEEDHLQAAAAKLTKATGWARLHALWLRSAAGVLKSQEITDALSDADPAVRITMARVFAEHPELTAEVVPVIEARLKREENPRVRLQLMASIPQSTLLSPSTVVHAQALAGDPWTRAAVTRLAISQAAEVLKVALKSKEPDLQADLVARLFKSNAEDAATLTVMMKILAETPTPPIAIAALAALQGRELPLDLGFARALDDLAAGGDARVTAATLPLAARAWDQSELQAKLLGPVNSILKETPRDPDALAALASLPVFPGRLADHLREISAQSDELRGSVFGTLLANPSEDAAQLMISLLPSIPPSAKPPVLEALLARPSAARLLVDAIGNQSLTLGVVGPQILTRLAEHPDAGVREQAQPVVDQFRGAVEAKEAVIQRLLPDVSKPGNPAIGKQIFASCAACHLFEGKGNHIGPVLEGIGVHGVESLLTHIVDPNREVEPSYHTWNVSTRDGRSVSGFISRETEGSLFLMNAGGEVEVARDDITSRVDTGKSLMPEGFEGLGPDALRDLIAYLRSGEQRFRTIALGKAATADGSRGVYLSAETESDRVSLKQYGLVEVHGVPFDLQDPAVSISGKNVIVLKGGMGAAPLSKSMPESVEIPVHSVAGRIHILGGVAGWGFPADKEKSTVLTLTVVDENGASEAIQLVNGVDIADHAARIDVPGSSFVDEVEHGQIRYLWRDLQGGSQPIEKLILKSANANPAPMVAAITLEAAAADGELAPAPDQGGAARR